MIVLVCGGRNYNDSARVSAVLDTISNITKVVTGGAPGADRLAGLWAGKRGIEYKEFLPDWARDGRAAGPIRNAKMLAESNPDVVVAFPGSRGTAHMVRIARASGVDIIEVAP